MSQEILDLLERQKDIPEEVQESVRDLIRENARLQKELKEARALLQGLLYTRI